MDSLGAGYRPIGMDVDFEALRKCRTSGRRVFRGDLNNGLAVQSEVFDAVFAGEVLEHTYFPIEGLKEIHRVLKPGGLFLGSVPNSFRLKNRLKFLIGHEFEPNPLHFHFFSPEKLTALLVEAGFENPNVEFLDSRYLAIWPKLFGNIMVWASRRPIR
jgi:SAM-dependent methyltransferase